MPPATFAGLLILALCIAIHDHVVVSPFDCWHNEAPREWVPVVRRARRAWPFSSFEWSRLYASYEHRWLWSTPEWARGSPRALRLLRVLRLFQVPWVIGLMAALAPLGSMR